MTMNDFNFKDKRILLGITGSIAAYKTCELIRLLVKEGADVYVLVSKNALQFVTPLTLKTLSGHPVIADLFNAADFATTMHIEMARWAQCILVSPATANIIGKVANGIADDVISTTIMATKAPVIFTPAMNDQMYENPMYQANETKLRKLGYSFVAPEHGDLACGYQGIGHLASVDKILERLTKVLAGKR